jgi:hypothetical protein
MVAEFDRMIGFNSGTAFKGRYFHSGTGFVSDALSQVLPLLKNYSRKKLGNFADNLSSELREGSGIRRSLKRSAVSTAKSVLKDLTGGKVKRSRVKKPRKKKKQVKRKKVVSRSKADFSVICRENVTVPREI